MSLESEHEGHTAREREKRAEAFKERMEKFRNLVAKPAEIPTMSADIGPLLKELGLTIAAAESLTSGNLQAALGAVSGSSAYYRGGVTAYTAEAKHRILGVQRTLLAETNCVSAEVAKRMAVGVTRLFDTDIGLATTGYAEPDFRHDAPTPRAYWHIYFANGRHKGHGSYGEMPEGTSRIEAQARVTKAVLVILYDILDELKGR